MPPPCLSPQLNDAVEAILSASTTIPVKERSLIQKLAYKKISKYNLSLTDIHNPVSGKKENRNLSLGKIVPKTDEVENIIQAFSKMTKGAGARRLYSIIAQHFHGVSRPQIESYIQSNISLTKLHPTFSNKAPLKPVRASVPFERHQIDLVDFSSKSETKDRIIYRFVLSILDVFSRFLWLRPLCDKTSKSVVKSLVQVYLDQQWGAPKIIQTDQGGEFKGMVNSLCEKLGVRLIHSQAYHPQSQGKDERSHRVWKDCLRYDLQHLDEISWVDSLPDYCRIHNESVNSAIGCSPYRAMFGFHPHHISRLLKAGGESMDGYICEDSEDYETVEEHSQASGGTLARLQELQEIRKEVLATSDKSATRMIKKHLKANPPSHYEVGEIVLVRHLGKDKGVCRGGQKITSPKAVEGEIVEVNEKLHKYKVRIGKKLSWRSVSQITSITRQQEEQKRRHSRHADDYMNVMARLQKEMMMPTVLSSDSLLQKLEDMAGRRGCIVKHNSGGGNCMFLSLSDQIYHVLNIEMNALEVRENIVEHLKAHPNTIDGTPLEDFVSTQQSWEAYLSAMEAPGTWGDHLVLLGAVEFLQVDIEVLTSASETHPILLKTVKRQETTKKLFLGHISEFHYVSLHKLGQICSDCHLEMHMCQCVENINAIDKGSSPQGFNSEEEDMEKTSSDPLPDTRQVSRAFFQKEEQNLAMYLQNLMQGNFSGDRDGRGQRHTMFLESYPYQDVKAGFASQFIPAELYGHIIEWIRSTFTRRIHKDKSHPYTSLLTSVLTVRNVDGNLRKLSLQYMCATTHYILYVAVKEACLFLIQKCQDMEYQHLDKECSEMELHPKRL